MSEANEFVSRCLDACSSAVQHGGWFLLEHPEDLGAVKDEVPGTIWQWEEVHNLLLGPTVSLVLSINAILAHRHPNQQG